jgi:hypothetical protein
MKLIVHAGTGTIIEADDNVWILDTDRLDDETIKELLTEYGDHDDWDDHTVVDIATSHGRRIDKGAIELAHNTALALTPTSIRYEMTENDGVYSYLPSEVIQWVLNTSDLNLIEVAEIALNDQRLWDNYFNVLLDSIREVYDDKTGGK